MSTLNCLHEAQWLQTVSKLLLPNLPNLVLTCNTRIVNSRTHDSVVGSMNGLDYLLGNMNGQDRSLPPPPPPPPHDVGHKLRAPDAILGGNGSLSANQVALDGLLGGTGEGGESHLSFSQSSSSEGIHHVYKAVSDSQQVMQNMNNQQFRQLNRGVHESLKGGSSFDIKKPGVIRPPSNGISSPSKKNPPKRKNNKKKGDQVGGRSHPSLDRYKRESKTRQVRLFHNALSSEKLFLLTYTSIYRFMVIILAVHHLRFSWLFGGILHGPTGEPVPAAKDREGGSKGNTALR